MISLLINWPSQTVMFSMPVYIAALVVGVIIVIGVAFDVVGVAVAVAEEAPFHAMSSKKKFGARHAIALVRHADRVASFCNDIVGDVAASISGAAGAVIVSRIVLGGVASKWEALLNMAVVGVIAGLTVGGKAAGKTYALNHANDITGKVAYILASIERVIGVRILSFPETGVSKSRKKER